MNDDGSSLTRNVHIVFKFNGALIKMNLLVWMPNMVHHFLEYNYETF
jgi:hypothetical protein